MNLRSHRAAAFTLLELLIVMGIIAIMFGVGVPAFVQSRQKKPMLESVEALMEGLKQARATAILTGSPTDFLIRMEDRSLSIQRAAGPAPEQGELNTRMASSAQQGFSGRISDEVKIEMLFVNLQDVSMLEEVRARFHPNGTSDEFTIVLHSGDNEWRKISLEIITGLARMETDYNKFMNQ